MRILTIAVATFLLALSAQAQLSVVSLDPPINASIVAPNAQIAVEFDRAVSLPSAAVHFHIHGSVTGTIAGSLSLENGDQRLRFAPSASFAAGEVVHVELAELLQAQDATLLRSGGWSWAFRVRVGTALRSFQEIDSMIVRSIPTVSARVYGGALADWDEDGWVDIGSVCEDSNDIRMFLNQGGGTGIFDPFLVPTFPTGSRPSPSEHADLNGDGFLDLVTANTSGPGISVLLGNGNGMFSPRTDYAMHNGQRGIALLDADGDGHLDVATVSPTADNVAVRLNDGLGAFVALQTFNGGGTDEYALCGADMNNDGFVDLVVGCAGSQTAVIHLSNGNGTFTMQPAQSLGGAVWMMQAGDLNNDGNMDVSCANGFSQNGAILLGNGLGGWLGPAQIVSGSTNGALATDLGDLDGDGDLDWVLSNYSSGNWRVYTNNGAGVFAFDQSFPAANAGSCAGLVDIDNDRDIDMLLFDELADTIKVMRNLNSTTQQICQPGTAGVIACPCANPPSGAPRGCDNSSGTGGAMLTATGNASLAADTLVFTTAGEKPTALSLVMQGDVVAPSGIVFGQGVRCATGSLKRLYTKSAVGGSITAPQGADPSVHTRSATLGSTIVPGQHRWYFVYYRDPIVLGGCPSISTFNASGTLDASWVP